MDGEGRKEMRRTRKGGRGGEEGKESVSSSQLLAGRDDFTATFTRATTLFGRSIKEPSYVTSFGACVCLWRLCSRQSVCLGLFMAANKMLACHRQALPSA